MKIQHKFAFYMFFIVVLFLVTLSLLFYWYNRQSAIDASLGLMKITVQEESKYLSDRLIEKSKIAISIASSNTLTNAIEKSNKEFSAMVEQDRKSRIKTLNDRWITTTNINTPFIKSYMTNEVASALKLQQNALPGEIGEIFVTNRYGVIVGTTNKLSTLAHSHKYWWQATYDNGKGKIFFDDRGYDESVGGYVIGIVIPIKKNNEIIGILKCNFNLLPTLSYYLDSLDRNSEQTDQWPRHVKLVRSSGRIVLTKEATPLSTTLPDRLMRNFNRQKAVSFINIVHDEQNVIAAAPVNLTFNSNTYSFGGRYVNNDQKSSMQNMGWYLVITENVESLLSQQIIYIQWIVYFALFCSVLAGIIALLMGRKIAQPITAMTEQARLIGQGNMNEKLQINTSDELGLLADSFNKMRDDLQQSQNELLRKERLATLGQLTATVSHEIRNPLAAIKPAMFILKKKCDKNDAQVQNAIEIAERNIDRCDHIIDELLDFTRITDLHKSPTLIDDWLGNVVQELASERCIPLTKELTLNDMYISVDTDRLLRAIINVVDNSFHAMQKDNHQLKDNAQLTVRTQTNNERAEIIITDTGTGVSTDKLEMIFQPLFSTKGFGTGLGMSAVKQIMEQHDGGIHIKSQEGEGTSVTLWLPINNQTDKRT